MSRVTLESIRDRADALHRALTRLSVARPGEPNDISFTPHDVTALGGDAIALGAPFSTWAQEVQDAVEDIWASARQLSRSNPDGGQGPYDAVQRAISGAVPPLNRIWREAKIRLAS